MKHNLLESLRILRSNQLLYLLLDRRHTTSLLFIVDRWINDQRRIELLCLFTNHDPLKSILFILVNKFFGDFMGEVLIEFELGRVVGVAYFLLGFLFLAEGDHHWGCHHWCWFDFLLFMKWEQIDWRVDCLDVLCFCWWFFLLFGLEFDLKRRLDFFGRGVVVLLAEHPHFRSGFWKLLHYNRCWRRLNLFLYFWDVSATHDFCRLFIMNDLCGLRLDVGNGGGI